MKQSAFSQCQVPDIFNDIIGFVISNIQKTTKKTFFFSYDSNNSIVIIFVSTALLQVNALMKQKYSNCYLENGASYFLLVFSSNIPAQMANMAIPNWQMLK